MNTKIATPTGVEILGTRNAQIDEILTPEAMKFVVDLERRFGPRRRELLRAAGFDFDVAVAGVDVWRLPVPWIGK